MPMYRRNFISAGAAVLASPMVVHGDPSAKAVRVGIIGHTGRGDYGHGLQTMWTGVEGADVRAVADPENAGLAKTLKMFDGAVGYSDYRKMLDEVKPEVVAIGMRHIDQHCDAALAAIEAGVRGLYIEKPFCRSPLEADAILDAARKKNVKIAVAHRNRYHPVLPVLRRVIEAGEIGKVLEYRMRGKEDTRGGMLDLWVLVPIFLTWSTTLPARRKHVRRRC